MTVRMEQGTILLEGYCPSGDAEELLQFLQAEPATNVDWRTCEFAHTAVVQVLLAARCRLIGPPSNQVLRTHVGPALARAGINSGFPCPAGDAK